MADEKKPEGAVKDPALEDIKRYIAAKYPIVFVLTWEDSRFEKVLESIAKSGFSTPLKFAVWSTTDGLILEGAPLADTKDPLPALDFAIKTKDQTIFLFKDLDKYLNNNPPLIRKMRDAYQAMKLNYKTLFISSPSLNIPDDLSKEIAILEYKLPSPRELEAVFDSALLGNKTLKVNLSEEDKGNFIKAAVGLTIDEARSAFQKTLLGKTALEPADIKSILEEKAKIVKKDGMLEYVPIEFGIDEIGGLGTLKKWLEARTKFFTKEAQEFGLKPPKGVLLTGVSGCGKSCCIKAIASYWKLPLMRLDLSKVYGGVVANPEESMRRALKTIEAVSPAILWIEEIEKGVAGYTQGDQGVTARIFSSFLTWMQEKEAVVFVAATANEINMLPPELMRKGRFDEIFFIDLPSEKEREEIFKVHLRKRKHDPSKFQMINLSKATNGFSGAEIEQIVAAGLYEAFNEKRPLNDNDLYRMIGKTVPLSTTMAEAIKGIKRWADQRAVRASEKE